MSSPEVSAERIRQLRAMTGVGFMACKKALAECDNDLDKAVDYLRRVSGVKASGKAERETSEGVIACNLDPVTGRGLLLEVNCETDFVARSNEFSALVGRLTELLSSREDEDGNSAAGAGDDPQIEQERTAAVQQLGENIRIRRWRRMAGGSGGTIGCYLHNNKRIGVLVGLAGGDSDSARKVAMHVASENPAVVASEDVPAELLERERALYRVQAEDEGKPAELLDKIVAGRLKKFAAEMSLLEQDFILEPGTKVGNWLKSAGATVTGFIRFELGEKLSNESAAG